MSKRWGVDDLEVAWIDLHEANAKLRWFVGKPAYEPRRQVGWSQYAFNTRERPSAGRRTEEWTAVGPTEVACVRAMARCLREIGEEPGANIDAAIAALNPYPDRPLATKVHMRRGPWSVAAVVNTAQIHVRQLGTQSVSTTRRVRWQSIPKTSRY